MPRMISSYNAPAFTKTLREQTPEKLESFVTTIETTRKAIDHAQRPSVFEAAMDKCDEQEASQLPLMFVSMVAAVLDRAVRGHGATSQELSRSEARDVLAAGYDKLEGLEKQLVAHMLTRVRVGTDANEPSSPLGYDQKSARRFTAPAEELATLPPVNVAMLDALADRVERAIGYAKSAARGDYPPELARAQTRAQAPDWAPEADLRADTQQAILDYAVRVFDVAYAHALAQKQQDSLWSNGR